MPVVIFFACLDLEQKSSFPDEHKLDDVQFQYKKNPDKQSDNQIPESVTA